MNAPAKVTAAPTGLALLRQPLPDHQISKLPKETKKQAEDRKADQAKGNWPNKCPVCDGYHHPRAVHLDYVGHAAATDRLLDADPEWDWEPFAVDERGLPAFDANGGLWIRLTVCGKTRIGYGSADGKTGGDAKKEIIGDAIRNAGMRFGMALDLWHKGQLHADDGDEATAEKVQPDKPITTKQFREIQDLAVEAGVSAETICKTYNIDAVTKLPASNFDQVVTRLNAEIAKKAPSKQPEGFGELENDEIPY